MQCALHATDRHTPVYMYLLLVKRIVQKSGHPHQEEISYLKQGKGARCGSLGRAWGALAPGMHSLYPLDYTLSQCDLQKMSPCLIHSSATWHVVLATKNKQRPLACLHV
jgi:hypothetical protein